MPSDEIWDEETPVGEQIDETLRRRSAGVSGETPEPQTTGAISAPAPKMNELIISDARKAGQTRVEAIEIGRLLGEDTARQRGEIGDIRKERIERAMAYAAWEWDGRPTASLGAKVPPVPDFKKGKK